MVEDGRLLLEFSASWEQRVWDIPIPISVKRWRLRWIPRRAPASSRRLTNQQSNSGEQLLQITPGSTERRVWPGSFRFRCQRDCLSCSSRSHGTSTVSLPYPDPYRPHDGDPSGRSVIDLLERRSSEDVSPQDVAALFFEPIQSDGGLIVPPPGFLNDLDELCRSHGILMVCDEVKVGLGRSGLLNCFQHEGIIPDVVVGKGLGGGLPISALVGAAEILDYQAAFPMQILHGNPVSASAASVLNTIEAEGPTRPCDTRVTLPSGRHSATPASPVKTRWRSFRWKSSSVMCSTHSSAQDPSLRRLRRRGHQSRSGNG
ncbi:MAG: aminotransferase class III-fold pyridoxal phosphate-dependent enzyme [Acidimicrobiia bacterium]|nr:aminotransferase class III-fold pyridoxal phosphate-dependent enzyme [Acidimicrobiia bacterium]